MDVQVDEAGSHDQPARVEFFVCSASNLAGRRDFRDLAVAQQDVHGRVDLGGGIDEASAFDQQAVIFFS